MAQVVAVDFTAAREEREARQRIAAVAAALDQAGMPGADAVRRMDARAMVAAGWSPMEIGAVTLRDALGVGMVEDGGRLVLA